MQAHSTETFGHLMSTIEGQMQFRPSVEHGFSTRVRCYLIESLACCTKSSFNRVTILSPSFLQDVNASNTLGIEVRYRFGAPVVEIGRTGDLINPYIKARCVLESSTTNLRFRLAFENV